MSTLLLKQEPFTYQVEQQDEDIPPISREELLRAKKRVGNNEAPGMVTIPNVALKTAIKAAPDMFLDIYNTCLAERIFPERWKRQKLVLSSKNNKPPDDLSSHRPLYMLNKPGKMLEQFIFNRIEAAVGHLLADNLYGFRKERSTLDAIDQVDGKGKEAISGVRWKRGSQKYCLLAAFDAKKAFNSARWKNICLALDRLSIPEEDDQKLSGKSTRVTAPMNDHLRPMNDQIT